MTYNSGCAKIEVPTLNQDSTGPMLMVSHANTNPGLTKKWDTGRAGQVLPDRRPQLRPGRDHRRLPGPGCRRRSPSTDLKVKKAFVLNDNQTYGLGVAEGLRDCGQEAGHRDRRRAGVGCQAAQLHRPLPGGQGLGADLVYLGGIYDNNGGQLIKDKVAVLGPNDGAVKLFGPDGFTGYPDMLKLPESAGMYLTFAGLTGVELVRGRRGGREAVRRVQGQVRQGPRGWLPAATVSRRSR